jgi:hypothetical protein
LVLLVLVLLRLLPARGCIAAVRGRARLLRAAEARLPSNRPRLLLLLFVLL